MGKRSSIILRSWLTLVSCVLNFDNVNDYTVIIVRVIYLPHAQI